MRKGPLPFIDFIRLAFLVVTLPLILLCLGPLLVIAAIWGRLSLGRIHLDPNKHYQLGRIWALGFGLLIWIFTWGGLSWLWPNITSAAIVPTVIPTTVTSQVSLPTPTLTVQAVSPQKSESTKIPTSAPSPSPATSESSPTPTELVLTLPTATVNSLPSATATPIPIAVVTFVPTLTSSITVTTLSPTLAAFEQDDFIQTLYRANTLLVQYLQDPSADSQAQLKQAWSDNALREIRAFARQIQQKYQAPLTVRFEDVGVPNVHRGQDDRVTIQIQELWTFEAPNRRKQSLSNYTYILRYQEQGWVIIDYSFKLFPVPSPE